MRVSYVAGGLIALMLAGCTAPTNVQAEKIRGTMASLTAPRGWTEPTPMQTDCMQPNLDCQDPNARRMFVTTVDVTRTCGELVGWVANNAVFEIPKAIVGTSEKTPIAADCVTELHDYGRYLLKARAPHDAAGDAGWKLKLAPQSVGYSLTVVIGAPPRQP
jgi:hypothetical protein